LFNKVFLVGRLTRDPELRYTSAGVPVARFTVAVSRPQRKDSGANPEADFIRVAAWRKLAEICGEYLKKGKLISIEGRLQISSFEKNGKNVKSAEVIADNMQMLDRKGDERSSGSKQLTSETAPRPEEVPF
jgi:single-strand DNA-binding protein